LFLTFCLLVISCQSSTNHKSNSVNILSKPDTTSAIPANTDVDSKDASTSIPDSITEFVPKIDYDTIEWAEIIEADSFTILDLRYATENNFTKQQIYDCARCFLRPVAFDKLNAFREHMKKKYGLGIILYDCYRPRPYQQKLWDIFPDPKFVGNPAKGSMHNRGMAVDIGLIDDKGNILDMGTDFDHFGRESFHSASNISKEAIKNRKLLKNEISSFGFKPITSEWWHYSYREDIGALSEWLWACD